MTLWSQKRVNDDEGEQKQMLLLPKKPHDRLTVRAVRRLEEHHLLRRLV